MVTNEEAFLQPVNAPAAEDGSTYQFGSRAVAGDLVFISTSCEDPVLAAKWLDFQYSKEGELLNWYGIEGEIYELDEEGYPQFTETVLSQEAPSNYLQNYALNQGQCWLGKNNWQMTAKLNEAITGSNQQMESVEIWSEPEVNLAPPTRGWTLTDDEGDVTNNEGTACTTMIDEYIINYILGVDTTSFEEFKETLLSYGYQNVIDAYQAAYDRYIAR